MSQSTPVRIARGAALLDKFKPDWWTPESVDLDNLSQDDADRCVLGQNYGSFHTGLDELGISPGIDGSADIGWEEADSFGFTSMTCDFSNDTAQWRRVIMERREQNDAISRATGSRSAYSVNSEVVITDANIEAAKTVIHEFTQLSPTYVGGLTDTGVLYAVLDALGVLPLVEK